MTKRASTVRALAVGVTAAVALSAAPAPAATPAGARYAASVQRIVNDVRADHDRAGLRRNACLQRFANRQANAMAEQRRLFHQDLGRVLRQCGLRAVAENVAVGPRGPRSTVRTWMGSAGHRANMADLLAWAAEGRLSAHVDAVFPLAETPEALRRIARREAKGKIVVRP